MVETDEQLRDQKLKLDYSSQQVVRETRYVNVHLVTYQRLHLQIGIPAWPFTVAKMLMMGSIDIRAKWFTR